MESKISRDIRVCGKHFPDWKVAVDHVGKTFVAKGHAEREYFEYIKKDMVESEAYMVIVSHLVLPRSVSEHGAPGNVFHFIKLEHPAGFGHESNDPVAYAITLTLAGVDSHTAGVSLLAGMLMKEGFVEELSQAGSDERLAVCIRKYEEQEKNIPKASTVCINGMGFSLTPRMTVKKASKELGIDVQVTRMDVGQSKGRHPPDVCITTPSLARAIGEQEGMILITTKNFTDVKTIKEKIREALNIEEQ